MRPPSIKSSRSSLYRSHLTGLILQMAHAACKEGHGDISLALVAVADAIIDDTLPDLMENAVEEIDKWEQDHVKNN